MAHQVTGRAILLTGVTGVIGGRVLLELLARTDRRVYCLVRDRDGVSALERMRRILTVYDDGHLLPVDWQNRVVALSGELTKPACGLDRELWVRIGREVGFVIHCAGLIRFLSKYESLRRVNVEGLANLATITAEFGLPLMFTSTYGVFGSKIYEDVTLLESDLERGQFFLGLNYHRSKYECERLLGLLAKTKGQRSIVVRLGDVMGDSKTGAYPLFETHLRSMYYSILKTAVDTGLAPLRPENFLVTPVDYVAEAMVHLLDCPEALGTTVHLINPHRRTFDDVMDSLKEVGYEIRSIPTDEYIDLFSTGQVTVDDRPYHSPFTSMMVFFRNETVYLEQAHFDTANISRILAPTGIGCARIDAALLGKYAAYCSGKGFFASPMADRKDLRGERKT